MEKVEKAIICHSEAEFREWFDKNYEQVGIKRIILSQEVCPDYVVEMEDGEIAKIEAELFAINFKYHKHDPEKADYILACYAGEKEVLGVPVIAINKLWAYETVPLSPLPPEDPLSEDELSILSAIDYHGFLEISALRSLQISPLRSGDFSGNHNMFIRFPPDFVASSPRGKFPRGKIDESIFNIISPEAKKYIKKYHHMIIGVGLSERACSALQLLERRGLVKMRPICFAAAIYDGTFIKHDGWVPTEVYKTPAVEKYHRRDIDHFEAQFWST